MVIKNRNDHKNTQFQQLFNNTIENELLTILNKIDQIAFHELLGLLIHITIVLLQQILVIPLNMFTMMSCAPPAQISAQPHAISIVHAVEPIVPSAPHLSHEFPHARDPTPQTHP